MSNVAKNALRLVLAAVSAYVEELGVWRFV
jgi:hypothetical protein